MEWEKCGQAWKLLDNLKNEGFEIIALEQDKKAVSCDKFKLPKGASKIALVVGESGRPAAGGFKKSRQDNFYPDARQKRIAQCFGGFRHRRLQTGGSFIYWKVD